MIKPILSLLMVHLYHCIRSSGTERKMALVLSAAASVEGSRSRSFVKYFGGTIKGLVEFLKSTRTIRVPSFPLTDTLASSLDGLHSWSPRNLELTRTSHLIQAQKAQIGRKGRKTLFIISIYISSTSLDLNLFSRYYSHLTIKLPKF